MAVDRAMQLTRNADRAPSTLRLYGWARPTATLGRFQDVCGVDLDFCAREGVDVVRRFTGGRGVLHADEVTYSLVAGRDDGIPTGTAASYAFISRALVVAYRRLGLDAELTPRERGDARSSACYLHHSRADLTAGGTKVSGSAQVWTGSTVLQHGSFPLTRDVAMEAGAFRIQGAERSALEQDAGSLEELLGHRPEPDEVRDAITHGFEDALGVALVPGSLTEDEVEEAGRLVHGRRNLTNGRSVDVSGSM